MRSRISLSAFLTACCTPAPASFCQDPGQEFDRVQQQAEASVCLVGSDFEVVDRLESTLAIGWPNSLSKPEAALNAETFGNSSHGL